MRCFKDGLDVPGLALDPEWFGAVFAKLLIVQEGFIELLVSNEAFIQRLGAEIIKLKSPGVIISDNFKAGISGFSLESDGRATFNQELYAYSLKVVSFEIIPPAGSGTLLSSYTSAGNYNTTLQIGWYRIELSGGGGGRGGNKTAGGNGGVGGSVGSFIQAFYNPYANESINIVVGAQGANGADIGISGAAYGLGASGGSGGGISQFISTKNNVNYIANGGGGGGGGAFDGKIGTTEWRGGDGAQGLGGGGLGGNGGGSGGNGGTAFGSNGGTGQNGSGGAGVTWGNSGYVRIYKLS
jgi:hypothetical protein